MPATLKTVFLEDAGNDGVEDARPRNHHGLIIVRRVSGELSISLTTCSPSAIRYLRMNLRSDIEIWMGSKMYTQNGSSLSMDGELRFSFYFPALYPLPVLCRHIDDLSRVFPVC